MRLAIIIPALDEAAAMDIVVPHARALADEVWVADGGSRDDTAARAAAQGAQVVHSNPGRGQQLNAGAQASDAELLLFLHADTVLPACAAQRVRDAIGGGAVGGGFRMRFDNPRPLLTLGAWLINLRTRLTACPLGDQAQFMHRDAFQSLGGYRSWPILEDLDLIRRLKRHGRTVLVAEPVTTSARRFVGQGIPRTIATNWLLWALYFCGVSPHRLARLYRHIR